MTWISLLPLIGVLAVWLAVKRSGGISRKAAIAHLRKGAMVIDVRSAGEFTAGHLSRAVNIPLSEIDTVIERKASSKDQVLLLHCQSGGRSRVAQRRLRALGYVHAYNLGSYARAAEIVGSRAS
jgi:rhodanese-related sulfurtransferase